MTTNRDEPCSADYDDDSDMSRTELDKRRLALKYRAEELRDLIRFAKGEEDRAKEYWLRAETRRIDLVRELEETRSELARCLWV